MTNWNIFVVKNFYDEEFVYAEHPSGKRYTFTFNEIKFLSEDYLRECFGNILTDLDVIKAFAILNWYK